MLVIPVTVFETCTQDPGPSGARMKKGSLSLSPAHLGCREEGQGGWWAPQRLSPCRANLFIFNKPLSRAEQKIAASIKRMLNLVLFLQIYSVEKNLWSANSPHARWLCNPSSWVKIYFCLPVFWPLPVIPGCMHTCSWKSLLGEGCSDSQHRGACIPGELGDLRLTLTPLVLNAKSVTSSCCQALCKSLCICKKRAGIKNIV